MTELLIGEYGPNPDSTQATPSPYRREVEDILLSSAEVIQRVPVLSVADPRQQHPYEMMGQGSYTAMVDSQQPAPGGFRTIKAATFVTHAILQGQRGRYTKMTVRQHFWNFGYDLGMVRASLHLDCGAGQPPIDEDGWLQTPHILAANDYLGFRALDLVHMGNYYHTDPLSALNGLAQATRTAQQTRSTIDAKIIDKPHGDTRVARSRHLPQLRRLATLITSSTLVLGESSPEEVIPADDPSHTSRQRVRRRS